MTRQQRNEYKLKWHRFQVRHERIYTVKMKKALQEQVQQYIETRSITSQPIYRVLLDLYRTCGVLWAARTGIRQAKREVKERLPMGFSERIVALMRQYYFVDLVNNAEMMTAKSREYIAQILSDAATSGASLQEVVRMLTTSPEFSAMRARRIARTETVTAANLGSLVNARQSGIEMNKQWLSINDKRTRHTHREIDGRTIPTDEYFNLDGVTMQHPGARRQENGTEVPASFVVNCRCVLAYEAVTDDKGRIVRSR